MVDNTDGAAITIKQLKKKETTCKELPKFKLKIVESLGVWELKSVNLWYITLGRLDDGTNESSTKCLMFQVLFFLDFL